MDDPWGSPWATDDAAGPPKLDLPAAPPPIRSSRGDSNARAPPAWEDDDAAWGGWNGGTASGANSPGWGRSPGLMAVPAATASRDVSPGPWDKRRSRASSRDVSPGPWITSRDGDRPIDSAISLGKDEKPPVFNLKPPQPMAIEGDDAWRPEALLNDESTLPSPIVIEPPARSESPEVSPPGPAVRPDERPEPVRQSSKVQELVDMYDGIAKRSVSPVIPALVAPPSRKMNGSDSPGSRESAIDEAPIPDDIEQLEQDAIPDEPSEIETPSSPKDETSLPDVIARENVDSPGTTTSASWTKEETLITPEQPKVQPKPPPKACPVDLSKLDELFPSTPDPNVQPEPLPDVIIDDTFASISERKIWYRISRFGSMRKHELGNDENYIRMDWQHSAMRFDSLKIVRRWMEEDSIAGRVVLGARQKGAIGASMFNWDSSAPDMEIGELLGKTRKGKASHSRESSASLNKAPTSPATATATFGWSSPSASPATATFPKIPMANTSSVAAAPKSRPQSYIAPPPASAFSVGKSKQRPLSLIMPPAGAAVRPSIDEALTSATIAPSFIAPPALDTEADEDADDDWGEMVSSPTVPTDTNLQTSVPLHPPVHSPISPIPPDLGSSKSVLQSPVESKPEQQASLSFGWDTSPVETTLQDKHSTSPPINSPTLTSHHSHIHPPLEITTTPMIPTPVHSPVLSQRPQQPVVSKDDNEAVTQVLSDLPDLSYMLR